jgi:hypothetical protein
MNPIKEKIKQKIEHINNLQAVELEIYQSILNDFKEEIETDVQEGEGLEPYLYDTAFNGSDFDDFWHKFINKSV